MKIHIELNKETALKDHGRGSFVGVDIHFDHEGATYPPAPWNDFAVHLLGFWLSELRHVRQKGKRTPDFMFMDGDFTLKGTVDLDHIITLEPDPVYDGLAFVWKLPLSEFETAVVDASRILHEKLGELDIEPLGFPGLKAELEMLEAKG